MNVGRVLEFMGASISIIAWLNLSNDAYDSETGVDTKDNKPESVVNLLDGGASLSPADPAHHPLTWCMLTPPPNPHKRCCCGVCCWCRRVLLQAIARMWPTLPRCSLALALDGCGG